MTRITSDLLLHAYAQGYFPMAEQAEAAEVFWVDPELRGILPLDRFHVPRRLARLVAQDKFTVTIDRSFRQVMEACASGSGERGQTWINATILDLYTELHRLGHAHSVECRLDDVLVGGLYGVSLGAAFFGESMFHRARDASKVALVHLVARLKAGGFRLLDTQFVTPHLAQFGAVEIPRADYRKLLGAAIVGAADFSALPEGLFGDEALQLSTQTS